MKAKRLNATAMSEVEVTHISLVKRGANRQPIKIHKSEDGNNTMSQKTLDLQSIGSKAIKSEQKSTPVLVAAIVAKGEGERVATLLGGVEELNVVAVKTDDTNDCDVINFIEGDLSVGNTIVYKYDDDMALVVAGVKETTQKMEFYSNTTSFKENVVKSSFFPNLREAGYTLADTVANIMFEDDQGYAAKVEAEVAAHSEYVNALVKSLPVKVLKSIDAIDFTKAEEVTEEAQKTEDGEAQGVVEDAKGEAETTEVVETTEAVKSEESSEEVTDGAAEETTEVTEAVAEETVPAWAQQLIDSNTAINERLSSVEQAANTAVQKSEEAAEATNEAKTLAEKAEAALGTARKTVVGDSIEEDLPTQTPAYSAELDDDLRDGGIELA